MVLGCFEYPWVKVRGIRSRGRREGLNGHKPVLVLKP